jgi:hypothetical protein
MHPDSSSSPSDDPTLDQESPAADENHPLSGQALRRDLLALGFPDVRREWPDHIARGARTDHVPVLIDLIENHDSDPDQRGEPGVYARIHAWRALAQLGALEAAPTLVRALDLAEDDDWVGEELPTALALLGPEVCAAVLEVLADRTRGPYTRAAAADTLVGLARAHPELRTKACDAIATEIEGCLDAPPFLVGLWIADLLDLRGVEWAPQIEAAYAEDRVDLFVCGDWEDVQIELGLLAERLTPPREGAPGTGPGRELLRALNATWAAERRRKEAKRAAARAREKEKRKTKRKNKQARKSRRRNRRK